MFLDEKEEKDKYIIEDEEIKTVFKEEKIVQEQDDEEIAPQDKDEYVVSSQIIDSEINGIIPKQISDEMRSSFLEYAMSVIVSRALPDARDGLKPVHRRILYGMSELGITSSVQHKKSARIVGDVLGKYHPHGDSSVYDAMVRMAQDFSLRYPLIDGHGNFGSIDGDQAAAMRYTEARMSKIAMLMVEGIKKDTVDFMPNYDGSEFEPTVLPAKFPNLLVSGVSGIAVGMATTIPPHNLKEVIDATIALARDPEISIYKLMDHIKGPDFPTGAMILGQSGIVKAYETGKGAFTLRSKARIEELKNGKSKIIVYEIPYEVKKPVLIEKIAQLVKEKKIEGIADIRDETSREGIRVVFDIKKGFVPEVVLNHLYKQTSLQISYSVNMTAIVNGEPKLINLKQALEVYLEHQVDVFTRRLQFDLKKAEERVHVLEGLKIAIENIDEVIKIIKSSKSDAEAQEKLGTRFELTSIQTKAIIDMRLSRLTGLAVEKLESEMQELYEKIAEIKDILASRDKLIELIIKELEEVKQIFGDERKTEISSTEIGSIDDEDLIPSQDVAITLTDNGYVKRINIDEYRTQNRGGVGSNTATTYEDDNLNSILITNTHTDLLIFTSLAKVYRLRAYEIPEQSKQGKGIPFINLISIEKDEKVISMLSINEYKENDYLVTVSKKGIIKKTDIINYQRINSNGKIALGLKEGDELQRAFIVNDNDEIIIGASNGHVVRFASSDLRATSRKAAGVKGINLNSDDYVVGASPSSEGEFIFALGEYGFGKKTLIDEYRKTSRGTKGVKTINSSKAGKLTYIGNVKGDEEILILTKQGIAIRTSLNQIPETSRNTKGVKIISLKNKDSIKALAKIDLIAEK
ncbi:DNA gyrase subunit A [Mesomycoplasma lagogenitalium]|uniref:DNA gyrase subunit A n=1 Tax=Mesomycoplasma lagogenitalium TaxID=171286 RepID=A0ABY8LUC7_9BACT|nr:DNA gyrase subunit A [Mesomycoplasma lagogenitalium]WGI36842.1 DNA gyrase subunit A [Mesomycoplasma lagogenitalium]